MKKFSLLSFFCFFLVLPVSFGFTDEKNSDRPLVRSIAASPVADKKIKLSWSLPLDFQAEELQIFASNSPIVNKEDLTNENKIAEIKSDKTYYIVQTTHYGDFYFAVVAKNQSQMLYPLLIPSVNTTVSPVRLIATGRELAKNQKKTERTYEEGQMREIPLPYLDILEDLGRKPNPLDEKVIKAGKSLAGEYEDSNKKLLEPYIFEVDSTKAENGDDYFLYSILKNYFQKGDYSKAKTELKNFLGVNRSSYTTNRAIFYLGESYYFCGDFKQALTMFLSIETVYPSLTRKWIDSALDLYEIE